MNDHAKESLSVTVGGETFRIRVLPAEGERYQRAAALANAAIEQVQSGSVVLGGPRAMAMALFQLAVELDDVRESQRQTQEGRDRLRQLIDRIDRATDRA
jgi:cell division protein ZapA (FtsZ GTPase activity inhibitor)